MTELSFLIQLLLNEKLPLEIKKEVAERIKDVEQRLVTPPPAIFNNVASLARGAQAPSTQRILDDIAANPQPVEAQAPHTQAAAQALQARSQAIQQAVSGKAEPGRTSPRKF